MTSEAPPVAERLPLTNPFTAGDAPARSLNRVWLMELPGVPVEEGLLGRRAGEVLSTEAVRSLVRAAPLPLDPAAPNLLHRFDACFDDPQTRGPALAVAGIVGRRLAAYLLALRRGDAANRAARPEWDDVHWAYWAAVERVVIGGGLLAGRLGEAAIAETRAFLAAANCDLRVERSPFGAAIALVGLARHAPPDARHMLLLDFGHTAVKCGLAAYHDGWLSQITIRPSLSAQGIVASSATAAERWERMAALIVAEWTTAIPTDERARTSIGLALATHLEGGHPFPTDRGSYGQLRELAPNLATFVGEELARRLSPYHSVILLHDGLAAASTRAGEPQTVVITLGTFIGVGYTLGGEGLRPVSANVTVGQSESSCF